MTPGMMRRAQTFAGTLALATSVSGGTAGAMECKGARGIDKAICASRDLRQEAEAFDAAFKAALNRAPDQAAALRTTERTWREERDKGCAMPNPDAFARCIVAQYKIRMHELALLVPETDPEQDDAAIKPGAYISDAVMFRLSPDGAFEMTELGGGRQASGHYAAKGGVLTLLDGNGDVGKTKFPLRCKVSPTADGFAVKLGQPQCRQLDGISFRLAT